MPLESFKFKKKGNIRDIVRNTYIEKDRNMRETREKLGREIRVIFSYQSAYVQAQNLHRKYPN